MFFYIYMIIFGQNLAYLLIVWKCFIYSGKLVVQYRHPDKFPTRFRKNLFNLEHFQIVWKSFIYSEKVSGQNLFLDMFPDKFLDKICFQQNLEYFQIVWKKFHLLWKSLRKKTFSKLFFGQKMMEKLCFWTKSGLFPDSM